MVNTLPTPCNWNHRSTVSRLTPYSRPCLWVHKSTVSRVISPPRYCTQGLMSTVSRWHPSQTLNLESHVLSLWGDNTSQCLHLRSNFHSLQGYPLPDPVATDTHPQHQLQTLFLRSHIQSPWWNTFTGPVPGVTRPQPPEWPHPPDLYLGSHIHCLKGDTPPYILYQWLHVQSPGWPNLQDSTPRLTRLQSPGWPHLPVLYLDSHVHSLKGDPTF